MKTLKKIIKLVCLALGLPMTNDGIDYLIYKVSPNKKVIELPAEKTVEENIDRERDIKPRYIRMTF